MRVNLGPYPNFYGVYQLADFLQYIGVSESRCEKIGGWLSDTWLDKFCNWVYEKRKRKIKVKIHDYDLWSLDSTLALIILPALIKIRQGKHGAPHVDDEDVPDHLKSINSVKDEHGNDDNWFMRWDYILDEMIWSFRQINSDWEDQYWSGESDFYSEQCADNPELFEMKTGSKHTLDCDWEGRKKHQDRIQNGLRLFGKYFQALWT